MELPWTISSLPLELLCWQQDKSDSRLPSFLVVYVAYRPDRLWQDSDHYCQGFRTSLACFLWHFLCFHQFSFLFGVRWKTSRNEARQHQFSALNLPSKDLVALVQASCRNRYNCSSKLYSEVLVAFYFRALLPGRIPLYLHLCIGTIGLVSLSYGLKLFLLLFQDILNLTEFFVVQKGKCASFFTEVAVNTLQKPS